MSPGAGPAPSCGPLHRRAKEVPPARILAPSKASHCNGKGAAPVSCGEKKPLSGKPQISLPYYFCNIFTARHLGPQGGPILRERQSCKQTTRGIILSTVTSPIQAGGEPVIWRMWPGKARRGKGRRGKGTEGEGGDRGGTAGSKGQRKSQNRPGLEPERVPGGRSSQCKASEVGPRRV